VTSGHSPQTGATRQAVSAHLAKLRLARLVHARREGRRQVYLIDDPHLVAAVRDTLVRMGREVCPACTYCTCLSDAAGPARPVDSRRRTRLKHPQPAYYQP
jgi:hypothetical protein